MTLFCVTLALLQTGFRFGGGDDLALLRAVESRTEGPLVAVAYSDEVSAFSFATTDRFWPRFQNQTHRSRMGDAGIVLQRGDYPFPVFNAAAVYVNDSPVKTQPIDSHAYVAKGRVVGEVPHAFRTGDLIRVPWSKPLRIAYPYRDVPIVAIPHGVSERVFLKAVAMAVGAKFSEDDAYHLTIDPNEFKSRAVRTAERWRANAKRGTARRAIVAARYTMLREAILALTNEEIVKAFESPESSARVSRPTPGLEQAVRIYFDTLRAVGTRPDAFPVDRSRAIMIQDIDPDKAMGIDVFGGMILFVGVPKRGGGTIGF